MNTLRHVAIIEPRGPAPHSLSGRFVDALSAFDVELYPIAPTSIHSVESLGELAMQTQQRDSGAAPTDALVVNTGIFSGRFFSQLHAANSSTPERLWTPVSEKPVHILALAPEPTLPPDVFSDAPRKNIASYFAGSTLRIAEANNFPSVLAKAIERALRS